MTLQSPGPTPGSGSLSGSGGAGVVGGDATWGPAVPGGGAAGGVDAAREHPSDTASSATTITIIVGADERVGANSRRRTGEGGGITGVRVVGPGRFEWSRPRSVHQVLPTGPEK